MGELWDIAQRHMDTFGVRAAALARRMGTSPQTLSSWKQRGVHQLPSAELLSALARETRTPYWDVLTAALSDAGYLPKDVTGNAQHPAPIDVSRADARSVLTDSELPTAAPARRTRGTGPAAPPE